MCINDPIQPRTGGLFGSSLEERQREQEERERERERENRMDGISGRETRIESLLVGLSCLYLLFVVPNHSVSHIDLTIV